MPDILGMDPDLAVSTLVESGLMVGEQRDMSDDDPAMTGKVCYASYTAGALVEPGTTIDIGISTGPASTTYMYQDAIQSPAVAEPGCGYQEGSECQITITGQSGTEYLNTTVRTFPYTSVNIHGIPSEDPAGLITYRFEVEEPARTEVGENGETVTVPGGKTQKVVQITVFFTPEG